MTKPPRGWYKKFFANLVDLLTHEFRQRGYRLNTAFDIEWESSNQCYQSFWYSLPSGDCLDQLELSLFADGRVRLSRWLLPFPESMTTDDFVPEVAKDFSDIFLNSPHLVQIELLEPVLLGLLPSLDFKIRIRASGKETEAATEMMERLRKRLDFLFLPREALLGKPSNSLRRNIIVSQWNKPFRRA